MRSLPRASQGSSNATTLMMCSFNKTVSITASVSFLYSTKCNQIFIFNNFILEKNTEVITIFIGLTPAELVTSELLATVKCYMINSGLII